jgi:hypothetical protein
MIKQILPNGYRTHITARGGAVSVASWSRCRKKERKKVRMASGRREVNICMDLVQSLHLELTHLY